jgi:hypothetical protein
MWDVRHSASKTVTVTISPMKSPWQLDRRPMLRSGGQTGVVAAVGPFPPPFPPANTVTEHDSTPYSRRQSASPQGIRLPSSPGRSLFAERGYGFLDHPDEDYRKMLLESVVSDGMPENEGSVSVKLLFSCLFCSLTDVLVIDRRVPGVKFCPQCGGDQMLP